TKSGHAGATHFSLRSSASFDDVNHFVDLQTKYGQGRFGVEADTTPGGACDDPGNSICRRSWGPLLPGSTPVFDHSHELYTTGHVVENGMTISGGPTGRRSISPARTWTTTGRSSGIMIGSTVRQCA